MSESDLDAIREANLEQVLDGPDLAADPVAQYRAWLRDAEDWGVHQADAAVLATVDEDGRPTGRHVLIRGVVDDELWFYSNRRSEKGVHLAANPHASLIVGWVVIGRQARFDGVVDELPDDESDRYWSTRPRGSRLAARASRQSEPATGRDDLLARRDAEAARWGEAEIPRPEHWGGYRLRVERAEVWQGGTDRLHDRFRYTRDGQGWHLTRLDP
ncbi:MAG: pyridoxamine 5'-phosphate oxidase [Actinomycetota bacterium]